MPAPDLRSRAGAVLAPLLLALAAPAVAADAWHAEAQSVLELLRADTLRALGAPAEVPAVPTPSAASATGERIELVALYGVTGAFTVVVEVDGARKEYRPGASLPITGAGGAREYRLVRVLDDCVLLRRASGPVRSACFAPRIGRVAAAGANAGTAVLDQPLPPALRR